MVVSALNGEGIDLLLSIVEDHLAAASTTFRIRLDAGDGRGLNWLYENAEVLSRSDEPDGAIDLTVRVPPQRLQRLQNRFPAARALGDPPALSGERPMLRA